MAPETVDFLTRNVVSASGAERNNYNIWGADVGTGGSGVIPIMLTARSLLGVTIIHTALPALRLPEPLEEGSGTSVMSIQPNSTALAALATA